MQETLLTKVAGYAETSRATVSKVLNHSFGVGDELREKVFAAADRYGLQPKTVSPCDVFVILPETPTYFWGELYRRLSLSFGKTDLQVKFNIYSKLGNCSVVARYLDEAEKSCAKMVVVAAHYDGLDQRLDALSAKKPVLVICEESRARKVIAIGSNQEADGMLLAKHCLAENGNIRNILLIGREGARLHGFSQAVENVAALYHISTDWHIIESIYSISRLLAETYRFFPFDMIVCLSGFTSRVCISMKKCGIFMPCYGFELPFVEKRYMLPGGTVVQDIAGIADKTVEIAERYWQHSVLPTEGNIYVPSKYLRFGE